MRAKRNNLFILINAILFLICFSNIVAAGEFEGSWILDDSNGKPFEATFSHDGKASGTHGDAMKYGTWKEENGAAVIHWTTGWTTLIEKDRKSVV